VIVPEAHEYRVRTKAFDMPAALRRPVPRAVRRETNRNPSSPVLDRNISFALPGAGSPLWMTGQLARMSRSVSAITVGCPQDQRLNMRRTAGSIGEAAGGTERVHPVPGVGELPVVSHAYLWRRDRNGRQA
jgi:hypothetical protein